MANPATSSTPSLMSLPSDAFAHLLSFMDVRFARNKRVCREFKKMLDSQSIWHLLRFKTNPPAAAGAGEAAAWFDHGKKEWDESGVYFATRLAKGKIKVVDQGLAQRMALQGRRLFCATSPKVRVVDTQNKKPSKELQLPQTQQAPSINRRICRCGNGFSAFIVAPIPPPPPITALHVSKTSLISGDERGEILVLDEQGCSFRKQWQLPGRISSLATTPFGIVLSAAEAANSERGSLHVWDVERHAPLSSVHPGANSYHLLTRENPHEFLASSDANNERCIELWDMRQHASAPAWRQVFAQDFVWSLASKEQNLYVGSFHESMAYLRLFDMRSQREVRTLNPRGDMGITSLVVMGDYVVSGSLSGNLRVWDEALNHLGKQAFPGIISSLQADLQQIVVCGPSQPDLANGSPYQILRAREADDKKDPA